MLGELVELQQGGLRLALAPAMGGSIAGFWHGATPLLRETKPREDGSLTVRETASFPMIPFTNRIAGGRFSFAGQDYELPRDPRDTRHAMHGNALYAVWDVTAHAPSEARLTLRYQPGQPNGPYFPFAYEATQDFILSPDGLHVVMRLHNLDTRPFPAGMGHHLYFPREGGARLKFNATAFWQNGPDGLPAGRDETLRDHFAAGEAVGVRALDHCFEGWDGQAQIAYPQAGYSLTLRASEDFGHAVVFVPPGREVFAFEPVTQLNDAVNRPGAHGLRVLAPGDIWEAGFSLTLG